VEQNGGHIWCESVEGEGATFKIVLPRSFGQPITQERAIHSRKGGNETLLIVEDEPVVLEAAVNSLRMRGYQVLQASNGPEALRVSQEYPAKIHLLVTDMVMPGMNGNELTEKLQRERPNMCVLRTSGYIESQPCLSPAQTDSFLQKPYTPSDLAKKVR
ncbi:MAG TPA: response regulator, partial [Armatimonadota bacterium]|nr:response regulator [Armatimonadota bacterium]